MSIKDKYSVKSIDYFECKEWLLKKHYAKRMCSISYSFGLHDGNNFLIGVCTFGLPPSAPLVKNVLSGSYLDNILELNRLVVNDGLEKNTLSFFVSECLNLLPKPKCIISFADPNNGHHGYIYQATNWLYTGLGSATPNYFLENGKQIHSKWVKKYKDEGHELTKDEQLPKHRYIYLCCDKKTKIDMIKKLKYKTEPYPKGENKRYDASYLTTVQTKLC